MLISSTDNQPEHGDVHVQPTSINEKSNSREGAELPVTIMPVSMVTQASDTFTEVTPAHFHSALTTTHSDVTPSPVVMTIKVNSDGKPSPGVSTSTLSDVTSPVAMVTAPHSDVKSPPLVTPALLPNSNFFQAYGMYYRDSGDCADRVTVLHYDVTAQLLLDRRA